MSQSTSGIFTRGQIAGHLKTAMDKAFYPLEVKTSVAISNDDVGNTTIIRYTLPFYPARVTENTYDVRYLAEPRYPLTCTFDKQYSEDGEFRYLEIERKCEIVIRNRDDWINHLHEFVPFYRELREIMKKIASAK